MSTSTFQPEPTATIHDTTQDAAQPGTVAKELVHRVNSAEVVVSDWHRQDGTHFSGTALWPRGHSFFTSVGNDMYDPLLVAETIRQLGLLLAHAELDVPFGYQFPLRSLRIAVEPQQLFTGDAPAVLDIDVTYEELRRQRNTVSLMRYQAEFRRNGALMATADTTCAIMSPTVYRRVRADRALHSSETCPPPSAAVYPPQTVGRVAEMDVALSPTDREDTWELRVDPRHPVFFDHPLDHVPGMLLFEAARQAAARLLGCSSLLLASIAADFQQYVELDAPCTIEAHRFPRQTPDAEETVVVIGHQNGALCFSTTVAVCPNAR